MSQLYVYEPSAKVGVAEGRVTVKYKDGMLRSLPIESVEGIALFGPVDISTQCMRECLLRGIDFHFYSVNGSYYGKLNSTQHVNVARQRAQILHGEDAKFRLAFAKNIIRAKIRNQNVVLRRYRRSTEKEIGEEQKALRIAEAKVDGCRSIDEVMGHEGNAARAYYKALSRLVRPEFSFKGRSKRPPLDPFNSMISLGYSILLHTVYGALESCGLNPYFGFMHAYKEKHPGLASDMMEEWRAVIVDSVVMGMINGREIETENFYTSMDEPGVLLDKEGFKAYVIKLEKRLESSHQYLDYADYPVAFRRSIYMQAGKLAEAIEKGDPGLYAPVAIR